MDKFEGEVLVTVRALLDEFAAKHPQAVPFALAMVARRLKTPWQLVRLATKIARDGNASEIAATRYAASVSMVLDHLDGQRLALGHALKGERVQIAKDILSEIYAVEAALRKRIGGLDASDWGRRLDSLMAAVAADLETELRSLPEGTHHVLGSCKPRCHQPASGMLENLRGMLGRGRQPGA